MQFFPVVALASSLAISIGATPLPHVNGITNLVHALSDPAPDPVPSNTISAPDSQVSHEAGGDEHVIILNNNTPGAHDVLGRIDLNCEHADVKYVFNNSAFQGFVVNIHNHSASALNDMDDVDTVEQSIEVSSFQGSQNAETRGDAPWGLQAVSSASTVAGDPENIQYTYAYDQGSALGKGVDVYIVDTGLNSQNVAFQGRVTRGWTYESSTDDGDGHGTHTAGTAAGYPFGLASNANIVPVKVLGANGAGSSSDTVMGLNYVVQQHDARKAQGGFAGSVMSMSWGLTQSSNAINTAIQAASAAGIHTAVAAGNSGVDACGASPAQLGGPQNPTSAVVSVGSVGQDNKISSFSNNGACVDIYAPGENIPSAWIGGPNMVNALSGTSMSTPHVSGLMAVLASENPSLQQDPIAMKQRILNMALHGEISGNTGNGGPALLLNNGITDATGTGGIL